MVITVLYWSWKKTLNNMQCMFIEKAEMGQTGLKCSMWGIIKSYKLYME